MKSTRAILFLVLLGVMLSAISCNIMGPAAYIVGGLPQQDAEYILESRATVVYVDDRANAIPRSSFAIRRAIADKVTADLMTNGVLAPELTINPRDGMSLAQAKDRHGDLLPVDAIGREVGAEQIIYIEMMAFTDRPDGVTPRPTAICRVRVTDVTNRMRLYPPGEGAAAGRMIQLALPTLDPSAVDSPSSRLKVLAAALENSRKPLPGRIALLTTR